jgi:hypothetical protein
VNTVAFFGVIDVLEGCNKSRTLLRANSWKKKIFLDECQPYVRKRQLL